MNNTLLMIDKILPWIILFAGIALCITLLGLGIYSWAFLHKKIDLKEVNRIKEENRQKLEDADALLFSEKYGPLVKAKLDELKELTEDIRKAKAELKDIEDESTAVKAKKKK